jgi:hypothetical protein
MNTTIKATTLAVTSNDTAVFLRKTRTYYAHDYSNLTTITDPQELAKAKRKIRKQNRKELREGGSNIATALHTSPAPTTWFSSLSPANA